MRPRGDPGSPQGSPQGNPIDKTVECVQVECVSVSMSSRPMALPSLSGLALRAHAPAHTGVGGEERKRAREDACAMVRDELEAVRQALSKSGPIDQAIASFDTSISLLSNSAADPDVHLTDDEGWCHPLLDVVMEYLGVVVDAAKRFSSTNSEERTMGYEALELLCSVAIHCNGAQAKRLVIAGCVTLGIRALRQWDRAVPLEETVTILVMVASKATNWVEDMMNGVDVLWEIVNDEDASSEVRRDAIQILEWIVEHGDEHNGKFRVYEHGNLEVWKLYKAVLYYPERSFGPAGPDGCNAVADILADPSKMRALLEAHPNVYDVVARMREDAKSCWSRFGDRKKAAIDAMLGSRGYQTAAALSPHAPSVVAAIALAKTLHGEAEAAIDDFQALFASSSLAPQAQDLVAATVEQAAKRGELATLRASEAECETRLAHVAASEGVKGDVLQKAGYPLVLNVHKAVEGVFRGYERVMGIVKVVHRLQAAHDPNPLGKAPNEDVERLREELFATETLATSETSPFSAHETNRLARMRPNQ